MTWYSLNECSTKEKERLPIHEHLDNVIVFFSHSGENNIFTYYIIKGRDKSYAFICCLENAVAFTLSPDEMENPFTLNALFDAASGPYIKKLISKMLSSFKTPKKPQGGNDKGEKPSDEP